MLAPSETSRQSRAASIAAAIGTISVVGIGLGLTVPLLAIEMERRGVSRTLIGVNTAVAGIANIVTAPFITGLVRRFGVGTMLHGALALTVLTLLAFPLTDNYLVWCLLRAIAGSAFCVLFVVSEFWINAAAPPERRGLVMGIYATAMSIAVAAGPAILGVVGIDGWAPYLAGAVVFSLGTLPVFFGAAGAPEVHEKSRLSIFALLRIAPSASLAGFIFGAVETGEMSFLAIYGMRRGLGEPEAALLMTLALLGGVMFQLPLGLLSDRMNRRKLLLACGLTGLAGVLALPFLSIDGWTIRGVLFVSIGVVAGLYTVGLAHLGARFHGAELAAANSVFVMLYAIGLTIGPPLVGIGMDAIDPHGFAYTLAAFFLFYVGVVAWRVARVP
ncbi:MFS transporter [Ancylobacter sp. 6x-1]|uniref:MFS transporter n=1 Tax=Ancylobacter crimeensis TaxID=2579147 RepID=A0ABT0DCC0_9HYPH|nr:MFS transporter [Ancylobacter crimeensis]MCK0197594.1 MFS transporter [Ancylobacter crimeensis]